MNEEFGTITIPICRNEEGRHVCRTKEYVCPYLRTGYYGTRCYCALSLEDKELGFWDNDIYGYTKPSCKLAPLEKGGDNGK